MHVVSPSTIHFIDPYTPCIVIRGKLTTDILKYQNQYDECIAIGGGAVMDAAKILSKNKLICYPTTASGSPTSSHSVVWDGINKTSVSGSIADVVEVKEEYCKGLKGEALLNTRIDLWAHAIDTLYSKHATTETKKKSNFILSRMKKPLTNVELVELGNLGGELIRKVSTTLMHGCSYPITGNYDIPHGRALGMMVKGICDIKGLNPMSWFTEEEIKSMSFWNEYLPKMDKNLLLEQIMRIDKIHEFDLGQNINASIIAEIFQM